MLTIQKHIKNEGIPESDRGIRSVLKSGRAGMTIEAALALPLFLFFVIGITYFMIILSLQTDIQLAMEETARSLGKQAYLAEHTADLTSSEGSSENAGILSAGINSLTIKTWMLKDGLAEKIDRSNIRGGTSGFYVYHSSYDRKTGLLDIIVNYTYEIPFLPESIRKVRFVQRSYSHVWTGKSLKELGGSGERKEKKQVVYITPEGEAYHLSTDCRYLKLSIQSVSGSTISRERNKKGEKYYRCEACCRNGEEYAMVFISDYGTRWHSDIGCPGLKRTIEAVDISEVGNRHLCPKCGGQH